MIYEIEAIKEALDELNLPSMQHMEPDDWDRLSAEWIVDYLHNHGFKIEEQPA